MQQTGTSRARAPGPHGFGPFPGSTGKRGPFAPAERRLPSSRGRGVRIPFGGGSGGAEDLPGPRCLPLVGNLHQIRLDRLHLALEDWAGRYGPLYRVRLGPRRIAVLSDRDEILRLLADRPDGFRRTRNLEAATREMGLKGVFAAEGEDWRRQRRLVVEALSRARIEDFFPKLAATVARLRRRWELAADSGAPVDLCRDLMRFTVDVTTQLAFGVDINTLETRGPTIQRHLDRVFPVLHRRLNGPFPYWRFIRLPADRSLDRALDALEIEVGAMVKAARARLEREPGRRESPRDFLEAIIVETEAEGSGATGDVIFANACNLLLAGEDTTANTIAWTVHLLAGNPDWFDRCRREVDALAATGADGPEGFERTKRMPVIDAVGSESMRLKPIAPLHMLEAVGDTRILGRRIPAGTAIFMLLRHIATRDEHFVNGRRFDPGRWLAAKDARRGPHDHRAFAPFGAGPRFCPGRGIAMLEIRTVLAMLCGSFDLQPVDGARVEERIAFTMFPANLFVRMTRRR